MRASSNVNSPTGTILRPGLGRDPHQQVHLTVSPDAMRQRGGKLRLARSAHAGQYLAGRIFRRDAGGGRGVQIEVGRALLPTVGQRRDRADPMRPTGSSLGHDDVVLSVVVADLNALRTGPDSNRLDGRILVHVSTLTETPCMAARMDGMALAANGGRRRSAAGSPAATAVRTAAC
jgi:hypothetical protein